MKQKFNYSEAKKRLNQGKAVDIADVSAQTMQKIISDVRMVGKKKNKKFIVQGLELIEKDVIEYPSSASRVIVPKGWIRVALIRIR